MKKGAASLSLILKIFAAVLLIFLVFYAVLDRQMYYDAVDFIRNLYEVPEVDPTYQTQRILIAREKGLEDLSNWIDAFEKMKQSSQDYCYLEMPATTEEFRREKLSIEFITTEPDSFKISLSQQNAAVSRSVQINAPFCMIVQPKNQDTGIKILDSFEKAFIKDNKPEDCVTKPESCALIFSKPETIQKDLTQPQSFSAKLTIQDQDRESRESLSLKYEVNKEGQNINIIDMYSTRITEAGYILMKLGENICIMPLIITVTACNFFKNHRSDRNEYGVYLFKRSCFYNNNGQPNENLNKIPKCESSILLTEDQAKQELINLLNNIEQLVTYEIIMKQEEQNNIKNNALFIWDLQETTWKIKNKQNQYINVTEQELLDETSQNSLNPIKNELKTIIINLRQKNKIEGITHLTTYQNTDLENIKINQQNLNEIIQKIRTEGIETINLNN